MLLAKPQNRHERLLKRQWLEAKGQLSSIAFCAVIGYLCYALPLGQLTSDSDSSPWVHYQGPSDKAPRIALKQTLVHGNSVFLDIDVANFILAEQCLDERQRAFTGHIHVYVNSRKWLSSASPLITLSNLPAGSHQISVSLNLLDNHRFFVVEGHPVQDSTRVNI